jgi:hypothetical protein
MVVVGGTSWGAQPFVTSLKVEPLQVHPSDKIPLQSPCLPTVSPYLLPPGIPSGDGSPLKSPFKFARSRSNPCMGRRNGPSLAEAVEFMSLSDNQVEEEEVEGAEPPKEKEDGPAAPPPPSRHRGTPPMKPNECALASSCSRKEQLGYAVNHSSASP